MTSRCRVVPVSADAHSGLVVAQLSAIFILSTGLHIPFSLGIDTTGEVMKLEHRVVTMGVAASAFAVVALVSMAGRAVSQERESSREMSQRIRTADRVEVVVLAGSRRGEVRRFDVSESEGRQLARLVRNATATPGPIPSCFVPHHGLVFHYGETSEEVFICFACSQLRWSSGVAHIQGRGLKRHLNRIIRRELGFRFDDDSATWLNGAGHPVVEAAPATADMEW